MRIEQRIAIQVLFVCCVATIATTGGVTYPDGTVSPFPPAFLPAGFPRGGQGDYDESGVYSVAAKDGLILAGVGYARNSFASGDDAVLFLPNNGGAFVFVDESGNVVDRGAFGISADGQIKVGGQGYWDAENHYHLLPHPVEGAALPGRISRDGSTIGGAILTRDLVTQLPEEEATLWATGGSGYSRLGFLPGYQDSSVVFGLTAEGKGVCGVSIGGGDPSKSIPSATRPFRLKQGGTMENLRLLPSDSDGSANGISADGAYVVGTSGPNAVAWDSMGNVYPLESEDYGGVAEAIDDNAGNIVGHTYTVDGELAAVLWRSTGVSRVTIKGLLANSYHVSIGKWQLEDAFCISGDGYTVGGRGKNPDGKKEGYFAVLPPILHPPKIDPIPLQSTYAGKVFRLAVVAVSKDPNDKQTFSASKLPPGFTISANGEISGTWDGHDPSARVVTVTIKVTDSQGSASRSFQLVLPPTIEQLNQFINGHGYLPLNKPPGEETLLASFGGSISGNGQVAVGHDGIGNDSRAYRWTQTEGISGLPMLVGALRDYGTALAASSDGNTIVGQAAAAPADDGSNRSVATVWKTAPAGAKTMMDAPTTTYAVSEAVAQLEPTNIGLFPGGIVSIANAVSADGSVVVGYGDATEKGVGYQIFQAFRWTASSGMVGLGWLPGGRKFSEAFGISPDGSTIVGVSDSASGNQAFRWTQAEGMVGLGKLPGATFTRANAISANNSVIIGYGTISGNNHAFRWTAAEGLVDLGLLPGDQFSEATAISADGSIIVGRSGIFPSSRPFIWDKANGMRDLKAVLVAGNPNLNDWALKTADGISADGKIVTGSGKTSAGDSEGYSAALEVRPAQPLNISTRMRVLTGDKVLIGGFIITGTEPKKVIVRGIGPSLANAGLQGALADPVLELHQGSSTIAANDNWKEHQAEVEATTIPPSHDLESAIVATLSPGAYTAILTDKNNNPGIGLVEIYDLTAGANAKLANISTRGFVDTGDNVMIGGFIVGNGSVGGFAKVIVRAIGPSLTGAGVPGALQDTTLELFDSNGNSVAKNDDWKLRPDGSSQQAEIEATTIPPKNDRESAILSTLAPGNYTAVVRGKNNATGVALVEAYNLQ